MATHRDEPTKKVQAKPAVHTQKGTEDPEEKIENALGRTEQFIYKHGKMLLAIVLLIVVVIGGYFAYKHLYIANRAEKAGGMMFVAQQNLEDELYEVALNGDGNQMGFLEVINQYGNTPQGNIAKHYAGECLVKLGMYDDALHYLKQYKDTDGVPNAIVNAQNYGLQADIYIQQGDLDRAVDMYAQAIKVGDNSYTSPMYLKKIGMAYMAQGNSSDAHNAFQRILDEYPASMEARDIEKYMGAASQL